MPSILLLPGDGKGPGAIGAAEKAISAAAPDVEIVKGDIGFPAYEKEGSYLPHETLDLVGGSSAAICGPTSDYGDGDAQRNPLDVLIGQLKPFARSKVFTTLAGDLGTPGAGATIWGCGPGPSSEVSETLGVDGITVSKYLRSAFYSRMMRAAAEDSVSKGYTRAACIASPDLFPESSDIFYTEFDEAFAGTGMEHVRVAVSDWVSAAFRGADGLQCLVVADLCLDPVEGAVAGITGRTNTVPTRYAGDFGSLYTVSEDPECTDGSDVVSAVSAAALALRDVGMPKNADALYKALSDTVSAGERPACMDGGLAPWEFVERVCSRLGEPNKQEAD